MRGIIIQRATWALGPIEIYVRVLTQPLSTYWVLQTPDYGSVLKVGNYDPRTMVIDNSSWREITMEDFLATVPGRWSQEAFFATWEGFSDGYERGKLDAQEQARRHDL